MAKKAKKTVKAKKAKKPPPKKKIVAKKKAAVKPAKVKAAAPARKPAARAWRICFDRVLPTAAQNLALQHLADTAKAHDIDKEDLPTLDASHPVYRAYMAVINGKKWPDGHTLTCIFLDGDAALQAKVIAKAKLWEQFANLKIDFVTSGPAQVRISFVADPGSWSAVGTDCLDATYFAAGQPTMNFGWLNAGTDDSEIERVVVHEFGHALGCIHEHQSPTETLDWDPQAVIQAFSGPPNNWTAGQIKLNILQKYGAGGVSATVFDPASIMLYQFDSDLFKDKKPTPLNMHMSDLDKSMIRRMYP